MTTETKPPEEMRNTPKPLPLISTDEDGVVQVQVPEEGAISRLFNVETSEAAGGLLSCLLNGLGRTGENQRNSAVALLAE